MPQKRQIPPGEDRFFCQNEKLDWALSCAFSQYSPKLAFYRLIRKEAQREGFSRACRILRKPLHFRASREKVKNHRAFYRLQRKFAPYRSRQSLGNWKIESIPNERFFVFLEPRYPSKIESFDTLWEPTKHGEFSLSPKVGLMKKLESFFSYLPVQGKIFLSFGPPVPFDLREFRWLLCAKWKILCRFFPHTVLHVASVWGERVIPHSPNDLERGWEEFLLISSLRDSSNTRNSGRIL